MYVYVCTFALFSRRHFSSHSVCKVKTKTMSNRYNLRRPSVNFQRELTEEEENELEEYLSENENSSDEKEETEVIELDSDSEISDNDSVLHQENAGDNAIEDVRLAELQRYIQEEDEVEEEGEPSEEGEASAVEPNRGQKYNGQGKNDETVWWSMPSRMEKIRTQTMKQARSEAFPHLKQNFDAKADGFKRILPPAIVEMIVIETNRKAKREYEAYKRENPSKRMRPWQNTDADEIYAYMAVILFAGAEKSNNALAKHLFAKDNMPFYRAVMSLERFEQLSRFMRFDDSRTRLARLQQNKLAPILHVWTQFLKNLTLDYVPSLEQCVDEQLVSNRNRCSFRQYIPSKPGRFLFGDFCGIVWYSLYNILYNFIGKYGIKIFWLVDAQNNYPLSAEIYTGTERNENRSTGVAYELVMRLCKDYMFLNANITMDNFFTSYKLANALAEKETTIVGTIRLNKREIPKQFSSISEATKRGAHGSIFCFSNACELVSYTTRSKKNVCLLSTAHATEQIDADTKKPVVILDYNKYKGGVDTFDKMLRCFTCKRKSNRWPMVVFYNMVDVAALAAYRLYELSHPAWKLDKQERRKTFLKEMAMELAKNHLERRATMKPSVLKPSVKLAMNLIGIKTNNTVGSMPEIQVNNKRRRCEVCKGTQTKDNKTTGMCDHCMKPTCPLHYVRSCEFCYLKNYKDPSTVLESEEEEGSDVHEEVAEPSEPSTSTPSASSAANDSTAKRRRQSIINL